MSTEPRGEAAARLMCEHRWVHATAERDEPHCAACGLGYREYAEGTVRAALSRMGAWP